VSDINGAGIVWITSDTARRQVGQLIVEAAQAISADHGQSVDSFRWWRDSWSDIQSLQDGMTIDAAGLSPVITAVGKILPPQSREQNDQAWIQQTRDNYVKRRLLLASWSCATPATTRRGSLVGVSTSACIWRRQTGEWPCSLSTRSPNASIVKSHLG
jgi:hypothetical protein